MPKPIVVEGPDGHGKSTLIEKLKADLDRPVIHTGGPPADREQLMTKVRMVNSYPNSAVLFDRIPHISEIVYRNAEDRAHEVPVASLVNCLYALDPVIVYCRTDEPLIDTEVKEHKPKIHMELVVRKAGLIAATYDAIMDILDHGVVQVVRYNWKTDNYDMLKEVLKCAE